MQKNAKKCKIKCLALKHSLHEMNYVLGTHCLRSKNLQPTLDAP